MTMYTGGYFFHGHSVYFACARKSVHGSDLDTSIVHIKRTFRIVFRNSIEPTEIAGYLGKVRGRPKVTREC